MDTLSGVEKWQLGIRVCIVCMYRYVLYVSMCRFTSGSGIIAGHGSAVKPLYSGHHGLIGELSFVEGWPYLRGCKECIWDSTGK